MKHFLFILLSYFSSCFYVSLLSQEDTPNRYREEHLRNLGITPQGKVKSVEKFIYHYDTKNGKEAKIFPKNAKVERMPVQQRLPALSLKCQVSLHKAAPIRFTTLVRMVIRIK